MYKIFRVIGQIMDLVWNSLFDLIYLNIKFISSVVLKLICLLDECNYVRYLNLFTSLKNKPTRFYYDKSEKIYYYLDLYTSLIIYFSNKFRALKYFDGIRSRTDALSKDYFLDLIKFDKGDIVIDCGANIGEVAYYFKINEIDIRYIGFEPSANEFLCLKKNISGEQLYNKALWINEGEIEFFVSSNKADSSIIRPVNYTEILKIDSIKLSSIIKNKVKLLKLEAEGAEPEVLLGAEDRLSLVEYISADLGPERGVDCESTMVPVVNYLLERNFVMLAYNHSRGTVLFKNTKI